MISARNVVDEVVRLTGEGPAIELADMFTEDAIFDMPMLPPGLPPQEPGREAFRAHLREGAAVQRFDRVSDVFIHETSDPAVAVAEYRIHGRILATGTRFTAPVVMVAGIRDGRVAWSRNYSTMLDEPEEQ
ncbi:nuclear transport factor 2 family protein [Micromonospora sicca]|uniref:nuclear transport factor 2 family protein n=1 Tax=Micromonospora sicca TaxID=2202420 RepID=UPI001375141A|nr:nuclear transport factor 2 family protein [Micromonospora sp. 4G51]